MSYTVSGRGINKHDALADATAKLLDIGAGPLVQSAVNALEPLLPEADEKQDVTVSIVGHCGTTEVSCTIKLALVTAAPRK